VNPSNGAFYVAGRTYSTSYPVTAGAFQTTCPTCNITLKNSDGFVTEFINGDQIWPLNLNFGNQTVGVTSPALNTVLSNSSNTVLHVSGIRITGSTAFKKVTDTCGAPIPVGSSCTVGIAFTPAAIGTQNATLTVTDDAVNSPQHVLLSGTGTWVQLNPGQLNFGNVTVGTQSAGRSVTLTNKGPNSLNIGGITLTGTNAGDFAQTNTCGSSIAAGGKCTITVTFSPTAKGPRTAAVSISDDGGGSPQKISLTGTGV
jgi:HYDIN/CFA65/VesB family protein/ASPM-SPD-2-Hydin domain-containing protein